MHTVILLVLHKYFVQYSIFKCFTVAYTHNSCNADTVDKYTFHTRKTVHPFKSQCDTIFTGLATAKMQKIDIPYLQVKRTPLRIGYKKALRKLNCISSTTGKKKKSCMVHNWLGNIYRKWTDPLIDDNISSLSNLITEMSFHQSTSSSSYPWTNKQHIHQRESKLVTTIHLASNWNRSTWC